MSDQGSAIGHSGFNVGDRVQRRSNVYDRRSRLLHGQVVAVRPIGTDVLYDVLWDGYKRVYCGYLTHGIDREVEHE